MNGASLTGNVLTRALNWVLQRSKLILNAGLLFVWDALHTTQCILYFQFYHFSKEPTFPEVLLLCRYEAPTFLLQTCNQCTPILLTQCPSADVSNDKVWIAWQRCSMSCTWDNAKLLIMVQALPPPDGRGWKRILLFHFVFPAMDCIESP